MDNKMVEVKESFWDKFKKFFQKVFLRNKIVLTNEEEKMSKEIDEAYYKGEKIEEDKVKTIEEVIDKNEEKDFSNQYKEVTIDDDDIENSKSVNDNNGENIELPKSKYQKTMVNGKEVRRREINDGETIGKKYIIVGEKECVHTKTDDVDCKRFIVYGYNENQLNLKGIDFTEKVRNKDLDMELSKTTKEGVTEEVRKGPLLDFEDEKYKGRFEYKDTNYENGNRLVEWTKELIDDDGKKQQIYETHSHTKEGYINTKYLNGEVVFQLVRNEKGTVIKQYDDKGNVINAYTYDKDGKPTETVFVYGEDGKTRRKPKTYKGIDQIPDNTIQFDENGIPKPNKEYDEYLEIIDRAGLPDNLNEILENVYENHIRSDEIKDFEQAKEQLNTYEQTKGENKKSKEQFEL